MTSVQTAFTNNSAFYPPFFFSFVLNNLCPAVEWTLVHLISAASLRLSPSLSLHPCAVLGSLSSAPPSEDPATLLSEADELLNK